MKKLLPSLRQSIFPLVIALISLGVALAGSDATELLRYERGPLRQGEIWRVVTGHLVHLGWSHLWLNLAGLVLIWMLVGSAFRTRQWNYLFLIACLGTSAGLWFFSPQVQWYVGLSGVLHGLLIAGALGSLGKYRDATWLIVLVAGKLAWEQWMGPMPGSEAAAGGPVVVAAHLYGALSGVVGWLLLGGWRRV